MLSKRQKELLGLLTSQQDFQTVEFFSTGLGVSKRTLHTELEAMERYFLSTDQRLEKKRGVGILLKRSKDVLVDPLEEAECHGTVSRRIEIMEMLLFKEEWVSFNYLADYFYVSKTSVKNDLDYVMKVLNPSNNIELKRGSRGTKLSGTEEGLQQAFLEFNRYMLSYNGDLGNEDMTGKIKILDKYYGEFVIHVCSDVLYNYVRHHINAISDYHVQNLLNIFVILVYRMMKGYHIEGVSLSGIESGSIFFEKSAEMMLQEVAQHLNLSYTANDALYLFKHLIFNRFETLSTETTDEAIIGEIIVKLSAALNVDFSNDAHLETQLKRHLAATIYRLKSRNRAANPFADKIKKEFSLTFNTIRIIVSEYEKTLGIFFTKDEIGFLTMYFQAAIERANAKRKILVVCQMGIATSELLVNRIKNVLPSLDSFEVASVTELAKMDLSQFQMIITTVMLDIKDPKIILVSPFLSRKDIQTISNFNLTQNEVIQQEERVKLDHLTQHIKFLNIDTTISNREDLLNYVGKQLVEEDLVLKDYIDSMIERENIDGTDMPIGVAIPHGNSIYAKETTVLVAKNKKKFKWKSYFIDLAFVVVIPEKDRLQTRNILKDIYNLITDSQILEEVRNVTSTETLLALLIKE